MPAAVLLWVWFCAYLNCAGWTLSAMHQLNPGGYAVILLLGIVTLVFWRKQTMAPVFPRWHTLNRRFRRTFPLAFLILTAMVFAGGALYAPTNYDGLTYRLPRVLHWLGAEQWHWIHTVFPRVNQRACGIEWISAPFLSLLKTDRLLFLINLVSFLLMPGLVFSVFTRLGVRRRVAWHWMWIAPTGYGLLLQAGSLGNDLFGAPFVLAAVDFALRAKISRSASDVFASLLAASLMTSAKTSDLPLLLPWGLAMLPSLKLLLRWPLRTAAVCVIALGASFLPTAILNAHYVHDWTGWKNESAGVKNAPLLRIVSNTALITVQNFNPPVSPLAGAWNDAVQKYMPADLSRRLHEVVAEKGAAEFRIDILQLEESAGLGFGVCVLLVISLIAVRRHWQFALPPTNEGLWLLALRVAPLLSLVALLSQSEVSPLGRILTPYYLLLLPFFLASPAHEQLVKRRWWRCSALAVFLIAAGLLVVSPARPLFPVGMFLEKIHNVVVRHPALARVEVVYATYRDRNDVFAPVRAALPPDIKVFGVFVYDDPETSLWRPFGSRRVEHIRPEDTAADLQARGIRYVLLKPFQFETYFHCSRETWIERMRADLVQKIPLKTLASRPADDWYLVKLP